MANRLLLLLLILLFTSCVPGKIRKIDIVGIQGVQVFEIGEESMQLQVRILVRNPHFTAVRVKNVTFDLGLTRENLGHGQMSGPLEIGSDDVKAVAVPLSIRYRDVREQDLLALFNARIPYHLTGKLELDKPVKKSDIKLDTRGTLPAPDRIPVKMKDKTIYYLVQFGKLKIRDFEPLSARSVIAVRVKNPFQFSIPLRSFHYSFLSNGRIVVDGNFTRSKNLEPGINVLEFPIRLHPIEGLKGLAGSLMDLEFPQFSMNGTMVLAPNPEKKLTIALEVK